VAGTILFQKRYNMFKTLTEVLTKYELIIVSLDAAICNGRHCGDDTSVAEAERIAYTRVVKDLLPLAPDYKPMLGYGV
jgi:hypothetical protein